MPAEACTQVDGLFHRRVEGPRKRLIDVSSCYITCVLLTQLAGWCEDPPIS